MENRPLIKKKSSGYASHDGNHMVGGSWKSETRLYFKYIDIDAIIESDNAYNWLIEKRQGSGDVRVEAYITTGYDHSVGIENMCDMEEYFLDEELIEQIQECPFLSENEVTDAIAEYEDIASNTDNYEPYNRNTYRYLRY